MRSLLRSLVVLALLACASALPVVDLDELSGHELLSGVLGSTDLELHEAASEDSCCHDVLDTSLEFLGSLGKKVSNDIDLSGFKPNSHVCVAGTELAAEAKECANLRAAKTAARWDVWHFADTPGLQFKLFNVSFEVGAGDGKEALCFGLSTCSKSFAISSDGALRAELGIDGAVGGKNLGEQKAVELELSAIGVSAGGGLGLTTKLGVWDGKSKTALTTLQPIAAQGVASLAGKMNLGPLSFKDMSVQISNDGEYLVDADLGIDELFASIARLAQGGGFEYKPEIPGFALISESASELKVELSKDPKIDFAVSLGSNSMILGRNMPKYGSLTDGIYGCFEQPICLDDLITPLRSMDCMKGKWPCKAERSCYAISEKGFAFRQTSTVSALGQTFLSNILFTNRDVRLSVGLEAWIFTVNGFIGLEWGSLAGIKAGEFKPIFDLNVTCEGECQQKLVEPVKKFLVERALPEANNVLDLLKSKLGDLKSADQLEESVEVGEKWDWLKKGAEKLAKDAADAITGSKAAKDAAAHALKLKQEAEKVAADLAEKAEEALKQAEALAKKALDEVEKNLDAEQQKALDELKKLAEQKLADAKAYAEKMAADAAKKAQELTKDLAAEVGVGLNDLVKYIKDNVQDPLFEIKNFKADGELCTGMTISFSVDVSVVLAGKKYAKTQAITIPWDPEQASNMIESIMSQIPNPFEA